MSGENEREVTLEELIEEMCQDPEFKAEFEKQRVRIHRMLWGDPETNENNGGKNERNH